MGTVMRNNLFHLCSVTALFTVGMIGTQRLGFGADLPLRSVCDVIGRLDRLEGKTVLMLANVTNSGQTISARCDHCSTCLMTSEHRWPNDIYIHFAVRKIKSLIQKHYLSIDAGVIALEGIVRVKFRKRRWLFGHREIDIGFGHLGVYPARIDVTSVRSCVVEPSLVCAEALPLDAKRCELIGQRGQ